ncbi:MAG: hypothetical protein SFW67_05885 [Myxococcaceae bacterium]|nr:hypothetical protein [Myxococcaceae bacterium]
MRAPALMLVVLCSACPQKPMGTGTPPERFCPYGPGCEKGNAGTLKVGIAAVKVTPRGFEQPRPDFLKRSGATCHEQAPLGSDGQKRCGGLVDGAFTEDCGVDRKCPGAAGYVAPDADGSERDGRPDFFLDCGRDQKCPGAAGYAGPDEDGSEGDGKFQGLWMAGFGNTNPAFGVLDDVWARAVVFENGDVSVALVSVDAVGLFRDDVERIRERVGKRAMGVPDYVLVSSTHTHESVDTMGQWGPIKALIPERGVDDAWLRDVFIEGAAQAVGDALLSARPAKAFSAQVSLGEKTRQVIEDTRDPWISDDTITVLKFTEARGDAVIGSLVAWGNHPETLSDVNNLISSDFVHFTREGVEKGVFKKDGSLVAAGLGGTCVYFSGSVGGLMTSLGAKPTSVDGDVPGDRTIAKTKAVGDIIAIAALEGLASATEEKAPNVAFGAQSLKVPIDNETFRLLTLPGVDLIRRNLVDFDRQKGVTADNIPHVFTEVSKVQLGGVRFIGVPGEIFPELVVGFDARYAFGRPLLTANNPLPPDLSKAPAPPYLNAQAGGEKPVVLGLANDELGYIVPEYDYLLHPTRPYAQQAEGDHYEETNSLGPRTTPRLMEAFKALFAWEPAP